MSSLIELKRSDRVFVRQKTLYAMVDSRGRWVAMEIVEKDGKFFRKDKVADLDASVIATILHQMEYFSATEIPHVLASLRKERLHAPRT